MELRDADSTELAGLVHREVLQTVALVAIAIVAFVVTRGVAAGSRSAALEDAEAWYSLGRGQTAAGNLDDAVRSFRRAAVRNRHERRYVLALARALALQDDTEQARAALLTLRETAPEDPEINLQLARLAAQRQDVTEAVRFYHNALYAPWPPESTDLRRQARFELIAFLLGHHQLGRALSELLGVVNDLPDTPENHVRVGELFARAGDFGRALDQFQLALKSSPSDPPALTGAGLAAFQLRNFTLARGYLRRAPDDDARVARARAVAELVVAADPLAARIGAAERQRRLVAIVEHVQRRLTGCGASAATNPTNAGAASPAPADDRLDDLRRAKTIDQDTIESRLERVGESERRIGTSCGPSEPMDDAIAIIVAAHAPEGR